MGNRLAGLVSRVGSGLHIVFRGTYCLESHNVYLRISPTDVKLVVWAYINITDFTW